MTWRELRDLATAFLSPSTAGGGGILVDRVSLDAEGTLRAYGRNAQTRRAYSETVFQADVASPYTWQCLGDGTPCALSPDCRFVLRDLLGTINPDPTLKTEFAIPEVA